MSNILERHLEQNIEPTTTKESYIDKAIQIFQDMKEEDITTELRYSDGRGKYCLCGLLMRMTGSKTKDNNNLMYESIATLGESGTSELSKVHMKYRNNWITFEEMRTQAIEYMESLK